MVTPIYNFTPDSSEELSSTLRGVSAFFVLCVGFSEEQATGFTAAYKREFSPNWLSLQNATCRVASTVIVFVDRYNFDAALKAMHYIPAVIVLNEGVWYTKATKRYVRKLRVPLVRVTAEPTAVFQLDKDDYYQGVCATIVRDELSNSDVVCPTLDYALLVSIRLNTEIIHRVQEARDATQDMKTVGSSTTAIPLEAILDDEDTTAKSDTASDSGTGYEPVTVPQARAAFFTHAQDSRVVRAVAAALLLAAAVI
jgi:hypothetical protein